MKFSIQTDVLKNITSTLLKVISRDVPKQSLGGVHIVVSSGNILFKTQQFDFNVIHTASAEETKDGEVYVSINVLDGVVNSLIDAVTTIELVDKKVIVRTITSTSELFILEDLDNDTAIEKPEGSPSFVMKREVLVRGFKDVQHAAAESVIKPEIASVYLYTKRDSAYFVSTDAFRLAEARFLLEKPQQDDVSILIPIKSIQKTLRVLEGVSDVDVSVYVHDNTVYMVTDNVLIKMNSVKGVFPDYKNIMPTNFDATITILRSDLLIFLKKARLFSNKLNKLSFSLQDAKSLTLGFDNETVGSTKNTIPASVQGSVENLPSFNYRFVSDAVSVISDDRIVFSILHDTTKPLMIRGVDDTTLTIIISPLLEK